MGSRGFRQRRCPRGTTISPRRRSCHRRGCGTHRQPAARSVRSNPTDDWPATVDHLRKPQRMPRGASRRGSYAQRAVRFYPLQPGKESVKPNGASDAPHGRTREAAAVAFDAVEMQFCSPLLRPASRSGLCSPVTFVDAQFAARSERGNLNGGSDRSTSPARAPRRARCRD